MSLWKKKKSGKLKNLNWFSKCVFSKGKNVSVCVFLLYVCPPLKTKHMCVCVIHICLYVCMYVFSFVGNMNETWNTCAYLNVWISFSLLSLFLSLLFPLSLSLYVCNVCIKTRKKCFGTLNLHFSNLKMENFSLLFSFLLNERTLPKKSKELPAAINL